MVSTQVLNEASPPILVQRDQRPNERGLCHFLRILRDSQRGERRVIYSGLVAVDQRVACAAVVVACQLDQLRVGHTMNRPRMPAAGWYASPL